MKRIALIVAGGSGQRMKALLPKQFMLLKGRPLLMYTLEAFHQFGVDQIILVIPSDHFETWKKLCESYHFKISHNLVAGGKTRSESVRQGLNEINSTADLVAIHDGVRPLVTQEVIKRCYETAEEKGNALAVVPPKDSLRKQDLTRNHSVDRANFYLVQTPQTFRVGEIKEAYANVLDMQYSDDASVLEANGGIIHLVAGDYSNIKVTTQEDIRIAEVLLN